jgi:hypothetical protein
VYYICTITLWSIWPSIRANFNFLVPASKERSGELLGPVDDSAGIAGQCYGIQSLRRSGFCDRLGVLLGMICQFLCPALQVRRADCDIAGELDQAQLASLSAMSIIGIRS